MIFEQLVNGTKPSAVVNNIVSDAAYLIPWAPIVLPVTRFVRRLRYELYVLAKTLAAYRVARSRRVACQTSDGTEKFQISLLTANVQIQSDEGDDFEPVILDAAFITPGKTAAAEVEAVGQTIWLRGRKHLTAWRTLHGELFPGDDLDTLFPDPNEFGVHRLGGGGVVLGDNCNQANACDRRVEDASNPSRRVVFRFKQKMRASIREAIAENDPNWSSYDDATKAEKSRTHEMDCWNHLRCVWFGGGSVAVAAEVKANLASDLENFSGYERVSTEPMNLIRGVYKEFHHEGTAPAFSMSLRR